MARWPKGENALEYLLSKNKLERIEALDLGALAAEHIARADRRLTITAQSARDKGDVDGAYAAAYDAYRMCAEALLARQGLRATGGEGSHMTVEDAVAAQFADEIEAFSKPTFDRFRRTRHTAQYFDPSAASITESDADWALEKSTAAITGANRLLSNSPPDRFL